MNTLAPRMRREAARLDRRGDRDGARKLRVRAAELEHETPDTAPTRVSPLGAPAPTGHNPAGGKRHRS